MLNICASFATEIPNPAMLLDAIKNDQDQEDTKSSDDEYSKEYREDPKVNFVDNFSISIV